MFSRSPKWLNTLHPSLHIVLGVVIGLITAILFYIIFTAFNPWALIKEIESATTEAKLLGGLVVFNPFFLKIDLVEAVLINLLLPIVLIYVLLRYTPKIFFYSVLISVLSLLLFFWFTKPPMLEVLLQAYVPDFQRLLFSNFGNRPCVACSGLPRHLY